MPAKSKSQQALMGQVHAYLNGDLPDASEQIKNIAKNMTKKSAKDFASTPTKELPQHVKEGIINKTISLSQFVNMKPEC